MEFDETENLHTIRDGEWNLILKGHVQDMSKLRDFNLIKLRQVKGINKTNTLVIASREEL